MLIYEVNLEVKSQSADQFLIWLGPHIDQVTKLGNFKGAQLFEIKNDDSKGLTKWSVQYICKDQEQLEKYIRDFAPKLRQEAIDLFGNNFTASRRILSHKSI